VVFGPGKSLYGESTRAILARLLEPPFFSAGIDSLVTDVAELVEGTNECGAFSVNARLQSRHSEPTFALRVDDLVAYCTDTAFDEENAVFSKGCLVLLHEAWSAEEGVNADTHTSAGEAGRIARQGGVGRLVLIHVNPLLADDPLQAAAQAEFEGAIVGTDFLEIDIS
jgi:ribonuclease BN (tRNA processing enzyme)